MIFAELNEDGRLKLSTSDPTEAYALRQWKANFDNNNASIEIETGRAVSFSEWCKEMKKDMKLLKQEIKTHSESIIVPVGTVDGDIQAINSEQRGA